jgi:hypothetical protein
LARTISDRRILRLLVRAGRLGNGAQIVQLCRSSAAWGLGRGDRRVNSAAANTLYRDRVCGIDIGKAGLVATIQVPPDKGPGAAGAGTRSFGMRVIT